MISQIITQNKIKIDLMEKMNNMMAFTKYHNKFWTINGEIDEFCKHIDMQAKKDYTLQKKNTIRIFDQYLLDR